MHMLYKLIALSVVFGLVIADPLPKFTPSSYDDLANYSPFGMIEKDTGDSRTLDLVVAKPGLISLALGIISKIAGLKGKAIAIAVVVLKWLIPKAFVIAIGALGALAFCKLTDKCSLAYDPEVYSYIPSQVRSLVTPERLESAQQLFYSAMQQYANEKS